MYQQTYLIQEEPLNYYRGRKQELQENNQIMQPKRDMVFKMLFGRPDQKNQLRSPLGSILNLADDELSELTIADPHLGIDFSSGKLGILDITEKFL